MAFLIAPGDRRLLLEQGRRERSAAGRVASAAAAGCHALVRAPCVSAPKMRRPRRGGSGGAGSRSEGCEQEGKGRDGGLALGKLCAALHGGAGAGRWG